MKSKAFLFSFTILTFILLFTVISINFFIDPGNIYFRKILIQKKESEIFNLIANSKFGIEYEGSERFLAALLAKNINNIDCVAIGSSHIMEMSIIMGPHTRKRCDSFLNLGVSGASIEDIYIFLELLERSGNMPSQIFIEIAPWTLKPHMDARYLEYSKYLDDFLTKNEITIPGYEKESISLNTYSNLLNLEYTISSFSSMKSLFKGNPFDNVQFKVLERDPLLHPPKKVSKLKDGSHYYSEKYREKNKTSAEYDDEPSYKLSGNYYNEVILDSLKSIIHKLQAKHKVNFVLTPYHHSAFKEKYKNYHSYLNKVESRITHFAKDINVQVFGSYSPIKVGCTEDEFFDYMHPTFSCTDKIFR